MNDFNREDVFIYALGIIAAFMIIAAFYFAMR